MIGKVIKGSRVGGLLRYLYGLGRANEHTDPHLAAAWDDPAALEPPWTDDVRRDFRPLTGLLEQPLHLGARTPTKPVWHCALRAAPADRRLSDAEWDDVAREVLDRTGLARRGDDGGCRWVAVRHAPDHVHLVVTLARQDGGRISTSNDFYRVGEACRAVEDRYGLTPTGTRDRTAAKRPTRGEQEKAYRTSRREAPRVALRREVAVAAAAASGPSDFLDRLRAAGLLVRERRSERDPGQVTGYAVALPGDRNGQRQPVWFGGGKLAADLSWPKLQSRWNPAIEQPRRPSPSSERLSGTGRAAAWERATQAAAHGAVEVRRLAITDPGAAADAAHATADALGCTARVVEGRRGGPLTNAAQAYDRASRELWGRTPTRTPSGHGLRMAARLLAQTGRARRDETTQLLALVTSLAALVDAVAHLRDVQARAAQAAAAREVATRLRAAVAVAGPRQPASPLTRLGRDRATAPHRPTSDHAPVPQPSRSSS